VTREMEGSSDGTNPVVTRKAYLLPTSCTEVTTTPRLARGEVKPWKARAMDGPNAYHEPSTSMPQTP